MRPPILLGRKNAVMSTAFFGSTTTVSIAHPTSKKANSPGPRQTSAGALGYKGRSDPSHRTRRMGHPQGKTRSGGCPLADSVGMTTQAFAWEVRQTQIPQGPAKLRRAPWVTRAVSTLRTKCEGWGTRKGKTRSHLQ